MRFAMKNGKICFSLRKFLAISPAIQKIASDCGCDAVVHLVLKERCVVKTDVEDQERNSEVRSSPARWVYGMACVVKSLDMFHHDKGQKSAILGHRLHSGESEWQPLNGSRRIVRKSTKTDGQKRSDTDSLKSAKTSEKVRKLSKKCENKRKSAKMIGMLFGDRFLAIFQ